MFHVQEYDIAILTLDDPITDVEPVNLADCDQTSRAEGKFGLVAGWGLTNPDDGNLTKIEHNYINTFLPAYNLTKRSQFLIHDF